MRRPEYLYVHEMRAAAARIVDIVGASDLQEPERERDRVDALLWNYTVLGEAAASLSQEFREQYAGIVWRRPIGLRNRIVHGYWSIDTEILIVTAKNDLPGLLEQLDELLICLEQDP